MKFLLLSILLLAWGLSVRAQSIDSLNYGPEPAGGISALALHYFKISFTKAQRARLDGFPLELIYSIDATGKPTLEKVNGVDDRIIQDSLISATQRVPNFKPQVVDGKAVNSVYFLSIRFPAYRNAKTIGMNGMMIPSLTDFESIETGGAMEILMGGVFNMFSGSAADYLKPGGGMKIDMLFTNKKGMSIGMDMSFYGNTRKQDYLINSTRQQNAAPPTLLIGLAVGKMKQLTNKHYYSMQIEANYAVHNVTTRIDNYDKGYTQFQGFSPGFVIHYGARIGKDKLIMHYQGPALVNHWINVHLAARPLFYDFKAANGTMIELGVSYRLITRFITSYTLKE